MSNDNNGNNNKIRRKKVSSSTNTNSNDNKTVSNKANPKRKPKSSKSKDKFKFLRVTGIIFLVLLVIGAAVGTGLVFSSLKDVEPVTKAFLDGQTHKTTKIYYANNELLANAQSINKKEPVSLDEMSDHLKHAVIAIEDERFYEHNGVDLKGLARAVVSNILTDSSPGGSTIPMQVSKMLLTSTEKSLPRKIKDIYYAYEMDKTLSKEEVLEAYLNNFFVGKGLIGAEAGARGYFDKNASELTIAESAMLAGSTQNPARYSAYVTAKLDGTEIKEDLENRLLYFVNTSDDNFDEPTDIDFQMIEKLHGWGLLPDEETYKQLKAATVVVRKAESNPKAKQRQEIVLMKMLELGYITQEEHDAAAAEQINIKLPKSAEKVSSSVEDYIESEVVDALMEQGHTWDEADNMFRNGGLIINTTIDPSMQDILEAKYENNSNFPGHRVGPDGISQPQSSMVILDYKTGQIKALVGGRNINGRKTLNRAINPKQPGSTIKPLSIYTAAIDTLKINQSTSLGDFRGGYKFSDNNKWNPRTTTKGSGYMSLRKGLAYSSNPVAIKTAEMLGDSYDEAMDIMIDYLDNFGITTIVDSKSGDEDNKNTDRTFAALTLGGLTKGISPLEMASAYGTLANGGVYVEPSVFTTITTFDGQLIVKSTPEEHKVVDSQVAYVMTDMLASVVTEGTGKSAAISGGMPVAGKTGTTNGGLDAWFVGYTPYYVGATYIGDDAGAKNPNTGETISRRSVIGGSSTPAKLWSKVMTDIHKNLTVTKFKVPENVYFTRINLITGGKTSSGSNAAFIKGTGPTKVHQSIIPETPKEEEKDVETTPDNNTQEQPTNPGNNGEITTPNNGQGGEQETPATPTTPTTPPGNTEGGNTEETTPNTDAAQPATQ